jgi:predicted nucleotidyltransferase
MNPLESAKLVLLAEFPRFRRLGINKVGIFGSVARDEAKTDSDVDILIGLDSDHHLTLFSLVDLEQDLSSKLHRKVELVIEENLKPRIRERALREAIYVHP